MYGTTSIRWELKRGMWSESFEAFGLGTVWVREKDGIEHNKYDFEKNCKHKNCLQKLWIFNDIEARIKTLVNKKVKILPNTTIRQFNRQDFKKRYW